VEIPIPHFFVNERAKALKEREKVLGQILAKLGPADGDKVRAFSCLYFDVKLMNNYGEYL
jgi:hypothetical protein